MFDRIEHSFCSKTSCSIESNIEVSMNRRCSIASNIAFATKHHVRSDRTSILPQNIMFDTIEHSILSKTLCSIKSNIAFAGKHYVRSHRTQLLQDKIMLDRIEHKRFSEKTMFDRIEHRFCKPTSCSIASNIAFEAKHYVRLDRTSKFH